MTPLREKLIKIGAKVVGHAKYVTFQLAEVAVPWELFALILDRIQRFGVPPPWWRADYAWVAAATAQNQAGKPVAAAQQP